MTKRHTRISSVRQEPSLGGSRSPSAKSTPPIGSKRSPAIPGGVVRWVSVSLAVASVALAAGYHIVNRTDPVQPRLEAPSVIEQAKGDIISSEGIRRDVMALLDGVEDAELSRYGHRIAKDLQGIMLSSEEGQSPLISWESLVRNVACANHAYGVDGVHLYARLKVQTLNTPLRQVLYNKAQEELARKADRDILARAQIDLDVCAST